MRSLFAAAVFAVLFAHASAAQADDVVFNVPVRIENTRDITTFSLGCHITYYLDGRVAAFVQGSEALPLVDGGYTGVVTITAPLEAGFRPTDTARWVCEVRFLHRDGTWSTPSNIGPWYTAKTGQEVASVNAYINTEVRP
jgi:hypothetical protein